MNTDQDMSQDLCHNIKESITNAITMPEAGLPQEALLFLQQAQQQTEDLFQQAQNG